MLADEVFAIVSSYIRLEKEFIVESLRMDEAGIDSARLVDIVLDLEDRFKIEIGEEAVEKFITVGDVIAFVKSKVA
jgi:acyl carrier protein